MMTQKSFFEQIGGIYTQVDSFLLPDLDVKDCEPTGKYGRTRKQYQKEQFEACMTAQRKVNVLTECETFCYVFRLGAKIMMDMLTGSTMKGI